MSNRTRPALIARLLATTLTQTMLYAALLFVPAGTLEWRRAWILVGLVLAVTLAAAAGLLHANIDLLAERLKPPIQKHQAGADKIVLPVLIAAFGGLLIFIPLDVFRFRLLAKPDAFVSFAGIFLFIAGWWIACRAMRANAFAAPVVIHQKERRHTVADSGPYRIVRHPMYAGGVLVLIGTPLWLESSAAALLAILPIGILVLRIFIEESFLRRALPGYAAYAKRVRYRLIPLVW